MNYMYANQECSSGCESGWTLYLEHSSMSPTPSYDGSKNRVFTEAKRSKEFEEAEEDEDLSMVSDASSGPPHLHEEEGYGGNDPNGYFRHCPVEDSSSRNSLNNNNSRKKRENRRRNKAKDQSLLDDTASSPLFGFPNKNFGLRKLAMENVVEYSQGFSTTQFDVRPQYQQHYDFFQSGNQMQQQNHRW